MKLSVYWYLFVHTIYTALLKPNWTKFSPVYSENIWEGLQPFRLSVNGWHKLFVTSDLTAPDEESRKKNEPAF